MNNLKTLILILFWHQIKSVLKKTDLSPNKLENSLNKRIKSFPKNETNLNLKNKTGKTRESFFKEVGIFQRPSVIFSLVVKLGRSIMFKKCFLTLQFYGVLLKVEKTLIFFIFEI